MPFDLAKIDKPVATNDRSEQARRAVKVFRAMQPGLSGYARAMTGRSDVKVVLDARNNGATDGKNIYYRPPTALGDSTPHDRALCDKRDNYYQLKCAACATREHVLVTIYHEIAHICFDSFQDTSEYMKSNAFKKSIVETETNYSKEIFKRIESNAKYVKSFLSLASLVNPFLPTILNCLEDARVNQKLFDVRPGTKVMFEADDWSILENGVEQVSPDTGEVVTIKWMDYPLNGQVMVGLFCLASGYDYANWFQPSVVQALKDETITELVSRLGSSESIEAVYGLCFPVLVRLRELGFCRAEDDPKIENDEPESDPQDQTLANKEENSEQDSSSSGKDSSAQDSESSSSKKSNASDQSGESDNPDGDSDGDNDNPSSLQGDDDLVEDDSSRSDSNDTQGSSGSPELDGGDRGNDVPCEESTSRGSGLDNELDSSDSNLDRSRDNLPDSSDAEEDSQGESESSESLGQETDGKNEGPGNTQDGGESGLDSVPELSAESRQVSEPIPMGTPEEVEFVLLKWGGHDEPEQLSYEDRKRIEFDKKAILVAIVQGMYFETESFGVGGVKEVFWKDKHEGVNAWKGYRSKKKKDSSSDITVSESVIAPALLRMRVAFSDNKRSSNERNRKSGRVDARVLGKRAFIGDDRLFYKHIIPGKKNYFVQIGMDISGSTAGTNIKLMKEAVAAQAELCSRMGINFSILGHSTSVGYTFVEGKYDLEVYHIKDEKEPWDSKTKERLSEINAYSGNLDGHALEFLRKEADKSNATNKVILYYSDGKMPATNADEELEVLQREIRKCKQLGYTLLGVGIRTLSPQAHGLPTVRVDEHADVIKVVKHLEKAIIVR